MIAETESDIYLGLGEFIPRSGKIGKERLCVFGHGDKRYYISEDRIPDRQRDLILQRKPHDQTDKALGELQSL